MLNMTEGAVESWGRNTAGTAIGRRQRLRPGCDASNPMPHRIFEIDEILRVIVWYTGHISDATTVSLACCCKAFEEPALSPLWFRKSLNELLPLLPSILTDAQKPGARPTEGDWKRFRRYASWTRAFSVELTPRTTQELIVLLNLITSSSSDGSTQETTATMFPNLRNLLWYGEPSSLTYLPSFVFPALADLGVYITTRWELEYLPEEYSPLAFTINSVISPSSLRSLCLHTPREAGPNLELRQGITDLVLRCGSALKEFDVQFELPESVILHLMSLPNLTVWKAAQPAPTALLSSPRRPSISLTKMRYLVLRTTTQRSWLSFISALVGKKSYPSPALHTPNVTFSNLTYFSMGSPKGEECPFSCTFLLTDPDISLLAAALPRLEWISLGIPCTFDTCQTTFRSLHTLSTRCSQLRHLCIHVNMATLVQDIRSISQEGDERTENQGPRPDLKLESRSCTLDLRFAQNLPLEGKVSVDELEMVVRGLFSISVVVGGVVVLDSNSGLWARVSEGIEAIRAQDLAIGNSTRPITGVGTGLTSYRA